MNTNMRVGYVRFEEWQKGRGQTAGDPSREAGVCECS
jgi:hypothetical protein